jgi:CDP-diacylglycerol--glycerol-3-phosphate 3-phosphatidyltransferase
VLARRAEGFYNLGVPRNFTFATLPNAITASRLGLAPLALGGLVAASPSGIDLHNPADLHAGWLALVLVTLVLAEISDGVDGAVARRMGATSDVGKLLDPLADSIFRFFVFLGFFAAGWIPLWMVTVFFVRDLVVAYLRVFAALQQVVLAARKSGKIKAVVQATAQIATVVFAIVECMGWSERVVGVHLPVAILCQVLVGLAVVVTAWSAVDYARHVFGGLAVDTEASDPPTRDG